MAGFAFLLLVLWIIGVWLLLNKKKESPKERQPRFMDTVRGREWLTDENEKNFMREFIENARKGDIVIRQVWAANQSELKKQYGEDRDQWPCETTDISDLVISQDEAFALGLTNEDIHERAAIYFIRKGVKAHYDELKIKQVDESKATISDKIDWKIYLNPKNVKYYAACMMGFDGWPKRVTPLSINMSLSDCENVKIFESRGYFGIEMIYQGGFFRNITPHTESELKEIFKTKLK